ncbi:membrane protein insertion efficiency factor YidD [Patescibacteria group bacterium]|nr:membrane protein insertion efficiency factor YidD [Patescibacteria group bacterium]MBU1727811.1 membrane protein insertion efficiency factor YidD [Patescibacteria group bacterium]
MKKFFIKLIVLYQKHISPFKRPSCVFYPTCSEYAKEAINKFGVIKGLFMSMKRIFRCHPWQKNHIDFIE